MVFERQEKLEAEHVRFQEENERLAADYKKQNADLTAQIARLQDQNERLAAGHYSQDDLAGLGVWGVSMCVYLLPGFSMFSFFHYYSIPLLLFLPSFLPPFLWGILGNKLAAYINK